MSQQIKHNSGVTKYFDALYGSTLDTILMLMSFLAFPIMLITIITFEISGWDDGIQYYQYFFCKRYWNSPLLIITDIYPIFIVLFVILNIVMMSCLCSPRIKKNILKHMFRITDAEIVEELNRRFKQQFQQECKKKIEHQTRIIHDIEREKENNMASNTYKSLVYKYL